MCVIPTLITCIGICGTRALWAAFVVPVWHDIRVVCLSYPLAWIITSNLFILYYLRGSWMKRHFRSTASSV